MAVKLENFSYAYFGSQTQALNNISLHAPQGAITLLAGKSGCGKTSVIRAACGLIPCYYRGAASGKAEADGLDISQMSLSQSAQHVGLLHQNPEHGFFALKVKDELRTPLDWQNLPMPETERRIKEACRLLAIEPLLESSVFELSAGEKQKAAIAGLLARGVKTLVLDEPSANLDPEAALELGKLLLKLKNEGYAILVADHRLYWLNGIADRVYVLKEGKMLAQGPFSILNDENLRHEAGLRLVQVSDKRNLLPAASGSFLQANGLHFNYRKRKTVFKDFSFDAAEGVCAIVGKNGSGKTTLTRILSGLERIKAGSVAIQGKKTGKSARAKQTRCVMQNADRSLHCKSVGAELYAASGNRLKASQIEDYLSLFNLSSLATRHPQSLSGGEKQRLAIVCALSARPSLLLLDEPTSGLDGENMRLIASALNQAAAQGSLALLVTHDLELLDCCCTHKIQL